MRRYFLTVSDKNPIMFNDMLCEYCAVEIGPRHGGVRLVVVVVVCLAQPARCLHGGFKQPGCRFVSLRLCSFSRGSLADLKLSPPQTSQVYRVVCFVCKWPSTFSAAPVISLWLPVRTGQIVTFPFFAFHCLLYCGCYRLAAAELWVLFRACLCGVCMFCPASECRTNDNIGDLNR